MGLSVLWILGVSRIKVTRDLKMEDLWSNESIHFRKREKRLCKIDV